MIEVIAILVIAWVVIQAVLIVIHTIIRYQDRSITRTLRKRIK